MAQANKNSYVVTTKQTLKVEMTRHRSASHFMEACNTIDEDPVQNPADILRRHGYIVDVVTTKHTIVKGRE